MRQRFFASSLLCLAFFGLLIAGAKAAAYSGQSYEVFANFYKEDIAFINDNDNRHLLPLVIAKSTDPLEGKRVNYSLIGDTLSAVITTDETGLIIKSCVITLTAPSGMEYGNALYNDFAISGYQSYALLMAMHTDPDPARRYALVTDVVQGMAANNGNYQRQLGVYTLTCTRVDNVAELSFQRNRPEDAEDMPEESPAIGEDPPFELSTEEDGLL